jgi:hypothetical protein
MMAGSSHAPSGVRILAKASDPAANEAAAANFQDQSMTGAINNEILE